MKRRRYGRKHVPRENVGGDFWHDARYRRGCLFLIIVALCLGALLYAFEAQGAFPLAPASTRPLLPADGRTTAARSTLPTEAELLHDLRVRKCETIVEECYPNSGFLPYCEVLIDTHERLEAEGGPDAAGFAAAWWESMIYGGANFEVLVGGTAPGSCAGPMDVKKTPLVLDPIENIEHHCLEMLGFYKDGVRGRDLCEHVFLPSNPRDWGGGKFARTEERHREVLKRNGF